MRIKFLENLKRKYMENRKKFEFEKNIIKIIEKNIKNVGIIYIFGSYAEGTEREKSDVDIAFY